MLDHTEIENTGSALWFGLFISDEELEQEILNTAVLDNPVAHPHITFGFKTGVPSGIDWNEIYEVDFTGYGNDGGNEGYEAVVPASLEDFYMGANTCHMTISTADGASPVDTAFIEFEDLEDERFSLPMKFGYYAYGKYHI